MKLSEINEVLKKVETIAFQLPNGNLVPSHFHVTEVGKITKHFIDCGGTTRLEEVANFQLWEANDYDHRLHPEKLIHIIELSQKVLQIPDLEIEVEYQMKDTIGKFSLDFDGINFLLISKLTNCLAQDKCGIPSGKPKVKIGEWKSKASSCEPNSGCC
ncbi:hypothetical protein SY27_06875 [Flavobacterium sp. 316]|uniref:DUF6428 family protein n=1 Tax=Flavobacterium sp. 316 TaxID=1603293 RepID=UPI0005DD5616|nr:DUF6428 family protein [Flavobacterium sp. 316]KIX21429.1 hypothetical protein SY27_06875 [Flavobacterium sp. 316]